MYYPESDIIASENPHLEDVIEKIDQFLFSRQGKAFDAGSGADTLRIKLDKFQGIVNLYKEKKLLSEQRIWLCPEDNQEIDFITDDVLHCDVCGNDYDETECKSRTLYFARALDAHETGGTKIMVSHSVFIGHGRSPMWRELKDFIQDRLRLPYEEFNRQPMAGITTIDRLKQMLDNSVLALLILTAEDERADGKLQARLNVIHEVGLFQGRLGFNKAIILLEKGCEKFSNIDGLTYIEFTQGNIKETFEEVRRTLEREGLLPNP